MCVSVRCFVWWFSRGCSHLEFVNISWCCLVTDDGVRHLVAKCTNIQYFLCKGCVKVMLLLLLHFPWVIDDAKCALVTRVCVSVRHCFPTLQHRSGCNLGNSRGVPSSCALLSRFAIGARVSLLWKHSANAKCQRVLVLTLCLIVCC